MLRGETKKNGENFRPSLYKTKFLVQKLSYFRAK